MITPILPLTAVTIKQTKCATDVVDITSNVVITLAFEPSVIVIETLNGTYKNYTLWLKDINKKCVCDTYNSAGGIYNTNSAQGGTVISVSGNQFEVKAADASYGTSVRYYAIE